MSEYILKAQAREAVGRAANNKLKTQGKIPGVYYHHGEPSRPLSLLEKDVQALLSTSHAIINLRVGGESYKAVAKEVQYSPVARRPIHISLEGVSNNEVFHTSVHVSVFHSETCPWQKAGGVVQTLNHEVEIECYPKDMPSELKVDVSDLEIGDAILLKHLKSPGVKFLGNPDMVIASIMIPRVEAEPEPEELTATEVAPAGQTPAEPVAESKVSEKADKKAS